jgi:UDP-N-acetylglucosamine 2-epimerase (non-hydrolysing)
MKKISVIFGTRPEAIKLAPVILKLQKDRDLHCRICVTAQHRELLDHVLSTFGIVPDADLDLMQNSQSLSELTARMVTAMGGFLEKEKPDLVLLQGDTTTVLGAALAAFYHRVPIGHVEAGLRTGNIYAPWPEEANRSMVSRIASLHFAPTKSNRENLLNEGVTSEKIFVTGNTVIDALFSALKKNDADAVNIPGLSENVISGTRPLILITGHRRESFGKDFESICHAISRLGQIFPDTDFVYPVHLNPRVREPVFRILKNNHLANIHIIDPLPYLSFIALMQRANLILTDSGGLQEEGIGLKKPVMVMRNCTERPEGITAKMAVMVGTDFDSIVDHVSDFLNLGEDCFFSYGDNPYGDGQASGRIVSICKKFISSGVLPDAC